jgi:hypothetical protein
MVTAQENGADMGTAVAPQGKATVSDRAGDAAGIRSVTASALALFVVSQYLLHPLLRNRQVGNVAK